MSWRVTRQMSEVRCSGDFETDAFDRRGVPRPYNAGIDQP